MTAREQDRAAEMVAATPIESRKCGMCGAPARRLYDIPERRVYACTACDGAEVISKGTARRRSEIASSGWTTPTWWYHGSKPRSQWPADWMQLPR
jgi:hypothetical protein